PRSWPPPRPPPPPGSAVPRAREAGPRHVPAVHRAAGLPPERLAAARGGGRRRPARRAARSALSAL
ncbi:MAG: hypothetical protein AVDCRST_MAG50-2889, partial [uncultured Acidimicrobiales bacterium]